MINVTVILMFYGFSLHCIIYNCIYIFENFRLCFNNKFSFILVSLKPFGVLCTLFMFSFDIISKLFTLCKLIYCICLNVLNLKTSCLIHSSVSKLWVSFFDDFSSFLNCTGTHTHTFCILLSIFCSALIFYFSFPSVNICWQHKQIFHIHLLFNVIINIIII